MVLIRGTPGPEFRQAEGAFVDGLNVDAVLSDSGKIELTCEADEADFTLNASGKIDALEMMATDVRATISGSGRIYVYICHRLTGCNHYRIG